MNSADEQQRLSRLQEQAQANEQRFLEQIAKRLGRPRLTEPPAHPYRGSPAYWQNENHAPLDQIALFEDNWTQAGGHCIHAHMEEACKVIVGLLQQQMAPCQVLLQQQPQLAALGEKIESELPDAQLHYWNEAGTGIEQAAHADIGIWIADDAVAYTGSVIQWSDAHKGRATSLLPPTMIVIVPSEVITYRLGDALQKLDRLPMSEIPAGFHVISGPSRSADIENDLTIGVHGPGIVYAIIVE